MVGKVVTSRDALYRVQASGLNRSNSQGNKSLRFRKVRYEALTFSVVAFSGMEKLR